MLISGADQYRFLFASLMYVFSFLPNKEVKTDT